MSHIVSWKLALVLTACAAVPALATDITPTRCPASCPGLVLLSPRALNESPGDQFLASVSGDLVAYVENASQHIHYYSFFNGATGQISKAQFDSDYWPDVFGSKIVFQRWEYAGRFPILVHDTSTGTTTEVDPQPSPRRFNPSIGGQTVAYIDADQGLWGVAVTDYSLGQPVTTVLSNTGLNSHPSVSSNGNDVVWKQCALPSGSPCGLMQATRGALGSWNVSQIVSPVTSIFRSETWPHVDGQWIVYSGDDNTGEQDIYIRSVDGTTQLRLVMPGNQHWPTVSSGVVLFSSVPDGSGANTGNEYDLYLFQISTSRMWRVTDTPWNETINDISVQADGSLHIVWNSGEVGARNVYAAKITLPSSATPGTLLQQLIDLVASYNLKQGISNSLDAKLQNAQKALDAARNNDIGTACNLVNAFMNEVSAQSGKSITSAQAQALLDLGLQIKQSLGCA